MAAPPTSVVLHPGSAHSVGPLKFGPSEEQIPWWDVVVPDAVCSDRATFPVEGLFFRLTAGVTMSEFGSALRSSASSSSQMMLRPAGMMKGAMSSPPLHNSSRASPQRSQSCGPAARPRTSFQDQKRGASLPPKSEQLPVAVATSAAQISRAAIARYQAKTEARENQSDSSSWDDDSSEVSVQ